MDIEHKVNWNGSNTEQGWFTPFFKSLKIAGYADLAHSEFKITHVRVARECKRDNDLRYPGYKGFDFGLVTAYHTNENAWCRLSVTDRCFINTKHLSDPLNSCGYSNVQDFWCGKVVCHEGQCHTDPGHTTEEQTISVLKARVAELELLVDGYGTTPDLGLASSAWKAPRPRNWDHLASDCTNCGEPAVTHNEFGFANCNRCAEEDAIYQANCAIDWQDGIGYRTNTEINTMEDVVNDNQLYNSHDDLEPYMGEPVAGRVDNLKAQRHRDPDLTFSARGGSIALNEAGDESLDSGLTGFGIVGALNELKANETGNFPYILTGSPGTGKTPKIEKFLPKTDDVVMQAAEVRRDIFSSNDRKNIAISSFRWSALQTCIRWAAAGFMIWQVV